MFGWFRKKSKPTQSVKKQVSLDEASVPADVVVYAIGDIHGRADLLEKKLVKILADPVLPSQSKTVVYLGDLVDRGLKSKHVIDLILDQQKAGLRQIWLMGNHEEFMLRFLDDPENSLEWLGYGGAETLLSYNVSVAAGAFNNAKAVKASEDLRAAMADAGHDRFIADFRDSYELGDYLFVHAGIDPERPIAGQGPDILRWIREPFLSHAAPLAKVVIHGHTVGDEPVVRHNRIGLDTGAYYSNKLTCLRLEGRGYRFL
ncbi:metallophosphoesterase family protein [Thalassospira sp. MCCC 1A01428]|uniref:metallophosphoesterase family protein n=1 Tax=Thalassospira sp. MCCC 1A01428 TaxID=1470575 RepID=UPI000A238012|nr:metallophosphoesterase family protein [Thalassospira sp. MCCC 1A01428]OSQ41778.1 hypothetical protein THS27_17500 [Thalassospira sp. MCCC 1A01428]